MSQPRPYSPRPVGAGRLLHRRRRRRWRRRRVLRRRARGGAASSGSPSSPTSWPPTRGRPRTILIVGSDTRDVVDEDAEDAGLFLDGPTGEGGRSDTIMILRRDPGATGRRCSASPATCGCRSPAPATTARSTGRTSAGRDASPRRSPRRSASRSTTTSRSTSPASSASSTRSAASRSASRTPPRTPTPGSCLQPGCQTLDGRMALAYARSRHYQEWRDGEWHDEAGRPDLNRIDRQQHLPAHGGDRRARRDQQQPVPPRRPHRRRRRRRPPRRQRRRRRGR